MNKDWIVETIETIAEFGKTDHGINRQAFSDADIQARRYVIRLMEEAGLDVRIDPIGNIIGRLEGKSEGAPAVIAGSHLDSVPNGGKYDGVVGVVGSLMALKTLKEYQLTHPLELIVFTAEESSRFAIATLGSKAMIGRAYIPEWKKAVDKNGESLRHVLEQNGFNINNVVQAARSRDDIKAFLELHIEQGPVLERAGTSIGIVEKIAAPTRLKITVQGMAGHSGTTPMLDRRDALVSASMIVLSIQDIALEQSQYGTVATVGDLKVHPGAINVIPGMVEMWVDIRGINHTSVVQCLQDIKDSVSTIADGQDTSIAIEIISSGKPVELSRDIMKVIENVCRTKGVTYQSINSGAGHDAMNMAQLAPTGMIFIPSHEGISHSCDEYTSTADIITGADILTQTLYELAK